MSRIGRPPALNAAKITEVAALLASGVTLQQAARHVGCTVRTLRRAAVRDPELARQLAAARAEVVDPLALVRRAASDHWRAAAWLLERTQPARFAARPAAACRPEQVEDLVARLIEAALAAANADEPLQTRLYVELTRLADERLNLLFPGGLRPSRVLTPLTDDLRLMTDLGFRRSAAPPSEAGQSHRAAFPQDKSDKTRAPFVPPPRRPTRGFPTPGPVAPDKTSDFCPRQ